MDLGGSQAIGGAPNPQGLLGQINVAVDPSDGWPAVVSVGADPSAASGWASGAGGDPTDSSAGVP